MLPKYLRHLGFTDIQHEPDGNVPPDLLADRRVAVEVRKLNHNEETGTGFRSLEQTAIPLFMKVRKLLVSLGPPPTFGKSWFVTYRFQRPSATRNLLKALRARLLAFRDHDQTHTPTLFMLDDGFEVRLFPAAEPHKT